jgi:pseudaminic acid synthase
MAMVRDFHIGSRRIGPGHPVYVVAEMSANHNQDLKTAIKIVEAAKRAGADAVKTQTYTADSLTIPEAQGGAEACAGTIWDKIGLYELYSRAFTPPEWQAKIQKAAQDLGIDFISAAFSAKDVDLLERLEVPVHKIASFEVVDLPLIEKMASTGKPLIISTGMATSEEIEEAVETAYGAGAIEIALLKCTSAYPAETLEMNLLTIPDMMNRFGVPVGLSDHSMNLEIPIAAVGLGACIIEKHLTLSRSTKGPDSEFSQEPNEFARMVEGVRIAESSIGKVHYGPGKREERSLLFRRSLYVVKTMEAGEVFSEGNVRSIRPSFGLHPRYLKQIIGRKAAKDIPSGTPLNWSLLED